ncbi:unnamed protein product [Caenorhabditis brenneri]
MVPNSTSIPVIDHQEGTCISFKAPEPVPERSPSAAMIRLGIAFKVVILLGALNYYHPKMEFSVDLVADIFILTGASLVVEGLLGMWADNRRVVDANE